MLKLASNTSNNKSTKVGNYGNNIISTLSRKRRLVFSTSKIHKTLTEMKCIYIILPFLNSQSGESPGSGLMEGRFKSISELKYELNNREENASPKFMIPRIMELSEKIQSFWQNIHHWVVNLVN